MCLISKKHKILREIFVNGYPGILTCKYLELEIKTEVSSQARTRHTRAVMETLAAKIVYRVILSLTQRVLIASSFYTSNATNALSLNTPIPKTEMEDWERSRGER